MLNNELSDFVSLIQKRVAVGSVPISTVRNMGPKDTMATAQKFLSDPTVLSEFSKTDTQESFNRVLEYQTKKLRLLLPVKKREDGSQRGGHWGCARKCLNVFLYECLLNRYLCDYYENLHNLESWLEVPLDSLVGTCLSREKENRDASSPLVWDTVIGLSPEISDLYQELAQMVADRMSICRVHLDLHYYRSESNQRSVVS